MSTPNMLQVTLGGLSITIHRGASIKYVRAEGGGVCPKADMVIELSKGRLSEFTVRGGRKPENPVDALYRSPPI